MKTSRIFLALAALTMGLSSCMKDLGNYDYEVLEDFTVADLEKSYSVISFQENLKIEPVVTSKSTEFEYRWFVKYPDHENNDLVDTLSREKNLDVLFNYKPGQYPLYLKVTNLETGVAKYKKTEVRSTTLFLDAFYVLKETAEGNTDMDVHYPGDNPATCNVIEMGLGHSLEGAPKSLSYLPAYSYLDPDAGINVVDNLLIPLSEKDMATFRLSDMNPARTNEEWFFNPFPVEKIRYFLPMMFGVNLITDEGAHQNYQCSAFGMMSAGIISDKPLPAEGEVYDYDVSSDVCNFPQSYSFFYSKKTGHFINLDVNATAGYCPMMDGDEPMPIRDEVLTLVGSYLDYNKFYIICKDASGKRFCYVANAAEEAVYLEKRVDFPAGSAMAEADIYAGCRSGSTLLYGVKDNQVFAYNSDSETSEQIELPGLPAGEIVFFDTMYIMLYENPDADFNYMMVGVDNHGKYALAMYEMIGGIPVKGQDPVRVLEGEGKIKTVQYVNGLRNSPFAGDWSIHY